MIFLQNELKSPATKEPSGSRLSRFFATSKSENSGNCYINGIKNFSKFTSILFCFFYRIDIKFCFQIIHAPVERSLRNRDMLFPHHLQFPSLYRLQHRFLFSIRYFQIVVSDLSSRNSFPNRYANFC